MEVHVPVDEFNSALWKRFQEGKIRNVYPLVKYKDIIEKIKAMNDAPPCNIPGEYYLLRKFVVANIAGKERLSCKSENAALSNSKLKFYVALEEIYNYIEEAHKHVKHGCRDRIVRRIQNQGIVNITRETVELFLSYCKLCRPRRREYPRKVPSKPTYSINLTSERFCDSPLSNTSNSSDNHRELDESLPVIMTSASSNAININSNESNSSNTVCTFTRGFIDLLDMKCSPDGDYRFIFLYIDIQTCFCVLYPTRCKCKYEIVSHLLNTFTLIGPPQILHSNFDNSFLNSILNELKQSWPDILIVSGSNNYEELQKVAENCIMEVNSMMKLWMVENNSNHWSFGLKIVQLRKNTKVSNNGTKSPYECFFGRSINNCSLPSDLNLSKLKYAQKEEDLLSIINEHNSSEVPYEHLQVSLDPNICKFVHIPQNTHLLEDQVIKEEPLSDNEVIEQNGLDCSESSNEDYTSIQARNLKIMASKRKKEACAEAKSRSGKYFQEMKVSDPERYKCHLAKEAARNKRLRSKLSEENKTIQREKTRLRAQKLRERRREEKQTKVKMQFQKKVKDMTKEERKEYDRVRKAESRAIKRKEEFVKEKKI